MDREHEHEDKHVGFAGTTHYDEDKEPIGPPRLFPSKEDLFGSSLSKDGKKSIVPQIMGPEVDNIVEDRDETDIESIIETVPKQAQGRNQRKENNSKSHVGQANEHAKHQRFFRDQINVDRPKWPANGWWFNAVAIIAYMVDMSNLTSFPVNVSKHGGPAYLIAYFTVLLFFAYPALCLEVFLGQYFETGMIGIWGVSPIGRGVGVGLFYFNFVTLAILPLNSMWSFLMMIDATLSLQTGTLVWVDCKNDWNTCNCTGNRIPKCAELRGAKNLTSNESQYENSPASEYFIGKILRLWKTKYADPSYIEDVSQNGNWSTAYGFNNQREGLGPLIPSSTFLLCSIFFFMFLLNLAKLKSLGHFYLFTTGFSIVVMALLLCRAVTLEGAHTGLLKYFRFDIRRLFDFSMWYVAFTNALFSVSCGMGGCVVQSSFNSLNHNGHRDVIVAVAVDTSMNFMGCLIAFMFVGHLYLIKNTPLPEEFPGSNFVFIALAESLSTVSGFTFFAAMFYLMIFLITLDTQVVTLNILGYSVYEEYKRIYPEQTVSKIQFIFSVWGLALSIGLICTTRGGYWIFSFVLSNALGLTFFLFVAFESFICSWLWGIENICIATESMMEHRPGIFLRVCWKYFLPFIIPAILVYAHVVKVYKPIEVFGQVGPAVTTEVAFVLEFVSIILMCIYSLYVYCKIRKKGKTCLQVLMLMLSPVYEHEEIIADVYSAKRLSWRHYSFILYDDEKMYYKEYMQNFSNSVKNVMAKFKKTGDKEPKTAIASEGIKDQSTVDTKKVKKKKKRRETGQIEDDDDGTSWDLWSKIKSNKKQIKDLDKEEEEEGEMKEEQEATKVTKISGKKHQPKSSFIDIDFNGSNDSNYPKTMKSKSPKKMAHKKLKPKGNRVKPAPKDLEMDL